MEHDLTKMSHQELIDLQANVHRAIRKCEQEEVHRAREQILQIAASVGIPLDDLIKLKPMPRPKKTGSVAAKYQNPIDPSKTWTGRGRQPLWIADAIKAGKTLAQLQITQ